MEAEIKRAEHPTLKEFADRHGLKMQITERQNPSFRGMKYYACFEGAEIREGESMLASTHGNGAIPATAIKNYKFKISGRLMIVDAMSENRREIQVPFLK